MPEFPILLVVGACAAMDGALALAVVLAPVGGRRVTAGRAALAAIAVGLAFLARRPLLRDAGMDRFGQLHLMFADLVVTIPIVGAVLLLAARWGKVELSRPARWLAFACLVPALVGVEAGWLGRSRLRTETAVVRLPDAREGRGDLRVGILADLQTDAVGAHEAGAVARLMDLRPDLILIPGDLLQVPRSARAAEAPKLRALLSRLSAPGGMFAVPGDVDGTPDDLRDLLAGTGVRLLVDEVTRIEVGGRRVAIAGLALAFDSPAARSTVRELEAPGDDGEVRVVLAHRPDAVGVLSPGSRVDLVVAGHTHGGQVVVPGFGPPITLSDVPRAVAAGGLHRLGGNTLYVSRGVGCERGQAPRIRFLCPPEISLLTLTSTKPDRTVVGP